MTKASSFIQSTTTTMSSSNSLVILQHAAKVFCVKFASVLLLFNILTYNVSYAGTSGTLVGGVSGGDLTLNINGSNVDVFSSTIDLAGGDITFVTTDGGTITLDSNTITPDGSNDIVAYLLSLGVSVLSLAGSSGDTLTATQSCPISSAGVVNGGLLTYTDGSGNTYNLPLENQKNYLIRHNSCTGDCQAALDQAQLALQLAYRNYCKSTSAGLPGGYGGINSSGSFVPDCQIGMSASDYTNVSTLFAAASNLSTAAGGPIISLALFKDFSAQSNNIIGYVMNDVVMGPLYFNYTSALYTGNNSYIVPTLKENIGDANNPYNSFYYIDFSDCSQLVPIRNFGVTSSAGDVCNKASLIKGQKYLYLFLSQKDDYRNLTIAEEGVVNLAFHGTMTSYVDYTSLASPVWSAPYAMYYYYLPWYSADIPPFKSTLINVNYSLTPISFNVIETDQITRTCPSPETYTDANLYGISATCKVNPAIDMCPPILSNDSPIISGNATWSGIPAFQSIGYSPPDNRFYNSLNYSNIFYQNTNQLFQNGFVPTYRFVTQSGNSANWSYNGQPQQIFLQNGISTGFFSQFMQGLTNQLPTFFGSASLWNGFNYYQNTFGSVTNSGGTLTAQVSVDNPIVNSFETRVIVGYNDYIVKGRCNTGTTASTTYLSAADNPGGGTNSNVTQPTRACRVYYIIQGINPDQVALLSAASGTSIYYSWLARQMFTPALVSTNLSNVGTATILGAHWLQVRNPCVAPGGSGS